MSDNGSRSSHTIRINASSNTERNLKSSCDVHNRRLILEGEGRCGPTRAMAYSFTGFLDHRQRRTTVGRTPLYGRPASYRELYLTTHNTHNRQASMPTAGFEPAISERALPQTYVLDRAASDQHNHRLAYRKNTGPQRQPNAATGVRYLYASFQPTVAASAV
jgi:hypothetical protein